MGRVVVDVMPKPEILDPQGKAVARALPRLGIDGFVSVRQGKRFELEVDGPVTEAVLAAARRAATTLLSNPVIEDVVHVAAEPSEPGVAAEPSEPGVAAEPSEPGAAAEPSEPGAAAEPGPSAQGAA